MAIVTGDRYLELLAHFLEENVAALLDGTLVLKLNPVGMHYVQTRLEALQELESLRAAAPVDYLRAYVADLGDHRALEILRRVLRLLGAVKVVSVLPHPARDPTPITLLPFGRLKSLELRGCDLSTSAARGLLQLRPFLEKLICHNSADALRHIFAERTVEIQDAIVWSRLAFVSCAWNKMLVMDEALQLLPAVEVLDLSRNRFADIANLKKCTRLKFLDLGYNRIRSVLALSQVASSISTLVLRDNALVSTKGIDQLYLLESLDLSHNIISDFVELERLGTLRSLQILYLERNPVTFSPCYREKAFSFISNAHKIYLDGRKMTRRERCLVATIIAHRKKQDSGYGLYTPAIKPAMPHDSPMSSYDDRRMHPSSKKKASRVAPIERDENGRPLVITEQAFNTGSVHSNQQDPESVHSPTGVGSKVEVTAQELMLQVYNLKQENSKTWLVDLNRLLENDFIRPNKEYSPRLASSSQGRLSEKRRQMRRRKRRASTVENWDRELNKEANLENDGFLHTQGDGDTTATSGGLESLRALEELVDAKLSSSSVASPPHYQQDLLLRRQSLEEELLGLRINSPDDSSTDSETSSELSSVMLTTDAESTGPAQGSEALPELNVNVPEENGSHADSKTKRGRSNGLSVGDESYFTMPMWIGSWLCEPKKEVLNKSLSLKEHESDNDMHNEIVDADNKENCDISINKSESEDPLLKKHKRPPRVVFLEDGKDGNHAENI